MKVSSPVGDFPFEPERVQIGRARLTLEGRIGAWPARVEIGPADGLRFAQLVAPLLAGPALGALVVVSVARRRRRSDG